MATPGDPHLGNQAGKADCHFYFGTGDTLFSPAGCDHGPACPGAFSLGHVGVTVGEVGLGASWLLRGSFPASPPPFVMELPPLRWPVLGNVYVKTATRVNWYLSEIMPLFVWASVIIWVGRITGGARLADCCRGTPHGAAGTAGRCSQGVSFTAFFAGITALPAFMICKGC